MGIYWCLTIQVYFQSVHNHTPRGSILFSCLVILYCENLKFCSFLSPLALDSNASWNVVLDLINLHVVCLQVSEMEVNGQFESVCESVFSELESQAVEALDLPMPGCFRMRSHSYVRAIEKGCSQDDECLSLRSSSPPRTTTTVRTIQSSTGELQNKKSKTGQRKGWSCAYCQGSLYWKCSPPFFPFGLPFKRTLWR